MKRKWLAWLRMGAALALALAVLYLGISAYVASLIWNPVRQPLHTTPAQYGLDYEDVEFASAGDGIPLRGWFIDTPGKRTIMVLHGSGSVRDNYINMEVSRALAQHGFDVLLFDFRGHGESGGSTHSLGAWETRDIAGALTYLKGRGVEEVGAIGYSMGAAALLLAAPNQPEIRALVADSSFADLFSILERERVRSNIPSAFNAGVILMSQALYGLNPLENEPKRAVARLGDRPVLLIHGSTDSLIPVSEAYELREAGASNPNLELWVAPSAGHVATFAQDKEAYLQRVIGFFDKHLTPTSR